MVVFWPVGVLAEPFTVGPYVLGATTDSATVAFHLREPMTAEVVVRDGKTARRFSSRPARQAHFVRVTGLRPGEVFVYEVRAGGGRVATPAGDGSYQIRTAGRPGDTFTFAVYGDTRPGETGTHRHHRRVVERMLRVEPAFCLVLGDMVDHGDRPAAWETFFSVESRLLRRCAVFPVRGDNDHARGAGLFARYFPGRTSPYHFQWGGVHFFGMDVWGSLDHQPPAELNARSPQVRWLRRQLQRPEVKAAPFRVVFLHDPVFIGRGRTSATMRRVWGPLLSRLGVDVVFASWHMYERSRHGGVTHVITGGAGAELIWMPRRPGAETLAEARRHHFCRVDVKASGMQIRAIADDGTTLDMVTLMPGAASPRASAMEEEQSVIAQHEARLRAMAPDEVLVSGASGGLHPVVWGAALLPLLILALGAFPGRRLLAAGGLLCAATVVAAFVSGLLWRPMGSHPSPEVVVAAGMRLLLGLALLVSAVVHAVSSGSISAASPWLRRPGAAHAMAVVLGAMAGWLEPAGRDPVFVTVAHTLASPELRPAAAGYLLLRSVTLCIPLALMSLLAAALPGLIEQRPAAARLGASLIFMATAGVILYTLGVS